jgi:hypothetical protein
VVVETEKLTRSMARQDSFLGCDSSSTYTGAAV